MPTEEVIPEIKPSPLLAPALYSVGTLFFVQFTAAFFTASKILYAFSDSGYGSIPSSQPKPSITACPALAPA